MNKTIFSLTRTLYMTGLFLACSFIAEAAGSLRESITGEFQHLEAKEGQHPFWLYGSPKLLEGGKYPLVINLHGARAKADPNELFKLKAMTSVWSEEKYYSKRPCFVVAPYFPPKGNWTATQPQLLKTLEYLFENLPIDRSRVYITGFSHGGQGTLQLLVEKPDWFAGAVTVAGPVRKSAVVGKITTPVWIWVGEKDRSEKFTVLVEAMRKGGASVKYNIVKGKGHNCTPAAFKNEEVHEWLFSQTSLRSK